MKVCIDCRQTKSLSEFHASGKKHRANCKDCRSSKDRRDKLRRHYNLTEIQYSVMYRAQDGVCKICKQPETLVDTRTGKAMALSIDHDHSCCPGLKTCGKCIRGLLCARCNTAIGLLEDDVALLAKSIAYLAGA